MSTTFDCFVHRTVWNMYQGKIVASDCGKPFEVKHMYYENDMDGARFTLCDRRTGTTNYVPKWEPRSLTVWGHCSMPTALNLQLVADGSWVEKL